MGEVGVVSSRPNKKFPSALTVHADSYDGVERGRNPRAISRCRELFVRPD